MHVTLSSAFYLAILAMRVVAIAVGPRRRARLMRLLLVLGVATAITAAVYWGLVRLRYPSDSFISRIRPGDFVAQTLLLAGLVGGLLHLDDAIKRGLLRAMTRRPRAARVVAGAGRVATLWLLSVPWLFVYLQTHRPKLHYPERPAGPFTESFTDGVYAWRRASATPSNVTVLLVHGIAADQSDLRGLGDFFLAQGWNVVSIDLPGHGRSAGWSTRFGLDGASAVIRAAERIRGEPLHSLPYVPPPVVIAVGMSLGGTTVLLAAQERPELFDGIVTDSAFARLEDMAEHQLARLPGAVRWPMRHVGRWLLAFEFAAPVERVDVLQRMDRLARTPKLFLHGTADTIVPVEQGRLIARAGQPLATYLEFEGGDHIASRLVDTNRYDDAVRELVRQAVTSSGRNPAGV